jgi:hypothetical protein
MCACLQPKQYHIAKPIAKNIIIRNVDNFVKICETLIFYENLIFEHIVAFYQTRHLRLFSGFVRKN